MTQKVLILGGQGRIGASVAADVLAHCDAQVTITGRQQRAEISAPHQQFCALDLDDRPAVEQAIAAHDLVIHCAGPFSHRDRHVLETCIARGVNYLDVADNPRYVREALALRTAAQENGVTAIVSTGVFPGISNSMVRQGIERLERADEIHLSYVVAGSGGAGVTVMRTTFLELQHPFPAWLQGEWRSVTPYSQRSRIPFPAPYGPCGVYWFNTVEAMTLAESFSVQTVTTKFGSVPDFYNHLTWLMAHAVPKTWLRKPATVEFLAQVSYAMTTVSDRFSGVGIAMRADIEGEHWGQPSRYTATVVHPDTAAIAGIGTGSIAQSILAGRLCCPGVWPVEQAVPTVVFEETLAERGVAIQAELVPSPAPTR
ncbi:MAG: saccharopine dehydrogenase NADP-binding domain-containing protein [Leptolyngbyaceae cyanobacterium T60_A2020_046]|nr:saccharopine dehydrogenase NADP-binding domain-containing protein [Leptolyngbyaceae cyanobacterium T60_A2020_046]